MIIVQTKPRYLVVLDRSKHLIRSLILMRVLPEWLAIVLCIAAAFAIYGQLLFSPGGFHATGDFGPAVGYAMNFVVSVLDGQWIPRWIVGTREFTFGGGAIDGTPPTIGSPAFGYYGFLQSAFSFPFLLAGIDGVNAVQLTVCLAFSLAAWVLYRAARMLGAESGAALAGAYSYLISPWLISNFYHRGGISEAMGQAGLPFFVLAFACLSTGRRPQAALWSAVGIAWVALGHNVFLLHSAVLCVLFTGVYVLLANLRRHGGLIDRFAGGWIIGGGIAIGLCFAAWQWYPAFVTLREISFHYIGNMTYPARIDGSADLSGAFGWPQRFTIDVAHPTDFFMTIGWWVLPAAALLLVSRHHWQLRVGLGVCFVWFFVMTYQPHWLIPHLPPIFGATQFSFRTLSYLSVISAIGVALAWPSMRLSYGAILVGLMTVSQLPVLQHVMPMQRMADEAYLGGYEYNAFYANSPYETNLRRWYDGWMHHHNAITFSKDTRALRVRGTVDPRLGQTSLHLSPLEDLSQRVSNVAPVAGTFDVTLVPEGGHSALRLMSATTYAIETQSVVDPTSLKVYEIHYSIRPALVSLLPAETASYVFAEDMELVGGTGYWRTFLCQPQRCAGRSPDAQGRYTVELPFIYNRFSVPTQDGQQLPYESDVNHRILVRVPRLDTPILVQYQAPPLSLAMTALGIMGTIGLIVLAFRDRHRARNIGG